MRLPSLVLSLHQAGCRIKVALLRRGWRVGVASVQAESVLVFSGFCLEVTEK